MISMSRLSICRIQIPQFLAALTVLSLGLSAHASNIVADGGFEAAGGANTYFAGQSIDGGSWTVTKGSVYIDSGDPYVFDGTNSLNLTGVNPYTPDSVSQILATVVGDTYQVNFWANADSSNLFSLTEDGLSLAGAPTTIAQNGFPGLVSNSSLFTDYTASFYATSASTTLNFSSTANPPLFSSYGSVVLDDVSLQATPEPDSIVLMFTGVVALGLLAGRKRLFGSAFAS
jgi:hypothetical protein